MAKAPAKAPDVKKEAVVPAPPSVADKEKAEKEAKTKANAEAAKDSQKKIAQDSLAALRATIIAPELAAGEVKETLFNEIASKVPVFTASFTRDGQQAFLDDIRKKAVDAETDPAKKEKMGSIYADKVMEDFIGKFIPTYYPLLADEVAGNISLDVEIKGGKVTISSKTPNEIKGAQKIADEKAQESAANLDLPGEMQRFQKDHPEAFFFLSQTFFKNPEDMKAAFAGTGLLGFFLGMLGYGGGKKVYSSIMKSEWFSKYRDAILDSLAKLDESLDFRDVIELAKKSDLDEYYKDLPRDEFRVIKRGFSVKNEITLPEVTTFTSVVFPKGSGDAGIAGASKDGVPLKTPLKRDEKYKNITVPKDTKIEVGTVFYGLKIGNQANIEAAQKGVPAAAPVVAAAPAAAASPAPAPVAAPASAPAAPPAAPAVGTAPVEGSDGAAK